MALAGAESGRKIRDVVQQFDIHEATLRKRLKLNLAAVLKIGILLRNRKMNGAINLKMFLLSDYDWGTVHRTRAANRKNVQHDFNEAKLAGKEWVEGETENCCKA